MSYGCELCCVRSGRVTQWACVSACEAQAQGAVEHAWAWWCDRVRRVR
jgi:hypothetical protein